jgi:hypothetical protein
VPAARPGARAPHAWVARDGTRLSTLDLFGERFTLLAGGGGAAWCRAARAVAARLRVPLEAYAIGPAGDLGDPDGRWAAVYGVEADGAVLVRPDGHVGWRAPRSAADPPAEVARALGRILSGAGPGTSSARP